MRSGYAAFLLRLWEVEDGQESSWRVSLESPVTGERQGFADMTELFNYLENEVCKVAQGQIAPSMGGKGGEIDD